MSNKNDVTVIKFDPKAYAGKDIDITIKSFTFSFVECGDVGKYENMEIKDLSKDGE